MKHSMIKKSGYLLTAVLLLFCCTSEKESLWRDVEKEEIIVDDEKKKKKEKKSRRRGFISNDDMETGAKVIVITGITNGNKYGAMCLDTNTGITHTHYRSKIPGTYYGTGDIFASCLCSALTVGKTLAEALDIAIDFVHDSIVNTQDEKDKYYYGVKFEQILGKLIENK